MDNCVFFSHRSVKKREPSVELAQGIADTDGNCQHCSAQKVPPPRGVRGRFVAERAVQLTRSQTRDSRALHVAWGVTMCNLEGSWIPANGCGSLSRGPTASASAVRSLVQKGRHWAFARPRAMLWTESVWKVRRHLLPVRRQGLRLVPSRWRWHTCGSLNRNVFGLTFPGRTSHDGIHRRSSP